MVNVLIFKKKEKVVEKLFLLLFFVLEMFKLWMLFCVICFEMEFMGN